MLAGSVSRGLRSNFLLEARVYPMLFYIICGFDQPCLENLQGRSLHRVTQCCIIPPPTKKLFLVFENVHPVALFSRYIICHHQEEFGICFTLEVLSCCYIASQPSLFQTKKALNLSSQVIFSRPLIILSVGWILSSFLREVASNCTNYHSLMHLHQCASVLVYSQRNANSTCYSLSLLLQSSNLHLKIQMFQ